MSATGRRSLGGTDLKRLHRSWRRRTDRALDLCLDGVQNPFNVGSILRSAAALGVEQVLGVRATGPSHPKVAKTALGAQRYLHWSDFDDPTGAVDQVRSAGRRLVGVELCEGAEPLFGLDLSGDVCLVVGHEERGLSAALLGACDDVGFVPLTGRIGSLNVAQATSIACYEVRRQQWGTTGAEQ